MPDLARSYKPVVRENLSLNVDAFPILAQLNIPQSQAFTRGVATGGFSEIPTAEAKAFASAVGISEKPPVATPRVKA